MTVDERAAFIDLIGAASYLLGVVESRGGSTLCDWAVDAIDSAKVALAASGSNLVLYGGYDHETLVN